MLKASLSIFAFVAIIGVSNATFQIPNEYYTVTETKTTYDQGGDPVPAVHSGSYVQTNQVQNRYGYPQVGYGQSGYNGNGQMQMGYGQGGVNDQMQTNHYQSNNHYQQTVTEKPACKGLFGCMLETAAKFAGSTVGTVLTAGGGIMGSALGGPEMGINMARAGSQIGIGLGDNIANTAGQIGV